VKRRREGGLHRPSGLAGPRVGRPPPTRPPFWAGKAGGSPSGPDTPYRLRRGKRRRGRAIVLTASLMRWCGGGVVVVVIVVVLFCLVQLFERKRVSLGAAIDAGGQFFFRERNPQKFRRQEKKRGLIGRWVRTEWSGLDGD